jgi:hypothetical protein
MISALKTVVLADTRWAGHHQTYLLELTAALLRCGVRIILMCVHPELIFERLAAAGIEASDERLRGIVFHAANRSIVSKSRDHDPLTTVLRWQRTGKLIREFEASSGWKADLVFLPYLDSYLRFLPLGFAPDILLGLPWSGLYFRNHHLAHIHSPLTLAAKGDYLLRSASCLAVCVLDERFNERISELSGGKQVIDFPDMTDETAPTEVVPEAAEILKLAAGRKIIGLISMEKRKGLLTLLKTALAAKEAGKPELKTHFPSLHFNLSHCDELAVIAASYQCPVGIDIESTHRSHALHECESTFCHPTEMADLPLNHDERAAALLELWTAKEAFLKAIGTGLSNPPEDLVIRRTGGKITAITHDGAVLPLNRLRHPMLDAHSVHLCALRPIDSIEILSGLPTR